MGARVRVKYATIFVFPAAKGAASRVSATPETLTVRPGDTVDWTVVNATAADSPGQGLDQVEGQEPGEGRAQGIRAQGAGPGPGVGQRAFTATASWSTAWRCSTPNSR